MISVIMTTYNCADYIGEAIQSILNQTFNKFEFIIIDDGSVDTTSYLVKQFKDSRIKYFYLDHVGRSKALNYGISQAKFDIIALMDADDIAHPLKLERQLKIISGKENEICFTDAAYFYNNRIKFILKNNFEAQKINEILPLHGHFINSTFLFNKKHILKFGGYNEALKVFEDYDLWLRIKDQSKFLFVPEILQYQRIRANSLTNQNYQYLNLVIYKIQSTYYKDLKSSFGIIDVNKQNILKGWREFFYGNKNLCRNYWNSVSFGLWDYRILLASFLSFFPTKLLELIKQQRLRLRINYILNKNFKFKDLDNEFRRILQEVSKK